MKSLLLLRKQNNLSQEEVAKKIGISQSNYSKYEMGKIEPNSDTIIKLADLFNISTDELLNHKVEFSLPAYTLTEYQKELFNKIKKLNDAQCVSISNIIDAFLLSQNEKINKQEIETYLMIKKFENGEDDDN